MFRRLLTVMIAVATLALTAAAQINPIAQPSSISASSLTASPNFAGFYAAPYLTGAGGAATVAGDYNNDGKPDVGTVDSNGNIIIFLNDGHGGFASPTVTPSIPFGTNINPPRDIAWAAAADFNGDGYTDIVYGVSRFDSNSLAIGVRLNQKNAKFGPLQMLTLPPSQGFALNYPVCITGRTTKSSHIDIVCGGSNNGAFILQTYLNNGSGQFKTPAPQTISVPSGEPGVYGYLALASADTNRDGNQDLLLARWGNNANDYIDIILGNGDGTFQLPLASSTIVAPAHGNVPTIAVGALTDDPTRIDIAFDDYLNTYTAMSNGDGTFQKPQPVPQASGAWELHIADLNGDGKPDLLTSGNGKLVTFLGNGNGTFGAATGTGLAHGEPSIYEAHDRTLIADFNGDSKLDFVNGTASDLFELGLGNGDGTFIATPLIHSASPLFKGSVDFSVYATPDLNGDGIADLVGFGAGSAITGVTTGKGTFKFQNAFSNPTSKSWYLTPAIGDFDGDGKQDVVLTASDLTATVALSNGDGTLRISPSVITFSDQPTCGLGNASVGDLNGDGKQDLIFIYGGNPRFVTCSGTTPSGYYVVLGKGDGSFQTPVFHPLGTGLFTFALAHFHGNNQPLDLIVGDFGDQNSLPSASILAGKGDGTFGPATLIKSRYYFASSNFLVDDFNQDGKADLTLATNGGWPDPQHYDPISRVELYSGNGDGTFTEQNTLSNDVAVGSMIYTDVNGDGLPDLVANTGFLSVFLGTGKGSFADPVNYFLDSNSAYLEAGRFLGDNTNSILTDTGISGGTAFFQNQGGTAFAVQPSSTSVTSGQSITISAALTPTLTGQPAPTGTVTYFDGSTNLGSAAVGTPLGGVQLAVGPHQISASYSGDTHFNPNTAAAVGVTVASPPPAPDFSFSSSATSLNITKGSTGSLTFNVAANSSLSGTVSFQCTGLPSESTCAFSPSSLTVAAGSTGSVKLTIGTKASSAALQRSAATTSAGTLGTIAMAGMLLFFLPRKRSPWMMAFVLASLTGMAVLTGCGGSGSKTTSPSDPGTPTGSSSVTVTATTTSGSATVTHAVVISLNVQ